MASHQCRNEMTLNKATLFEDLVVPLHTWCGKASPSNNKTVFQKCSQKGDGGGGSTYLIILWIF